MNVARWLLISQLLIGVAPAADLLVLPDYIRAGPRGEIVEPDRIPQLTPAHNIELEGARGSYVSCQLTAVLSGPGTYHLEVAPFPQASAIQVDLFREWFHFVPAKNATTRMP